MSILKELNLNPQIAAEQLKQFKTWLDENQRFLENQVVKQLKNLDHLSLLIGYLANYLKFPNVFKHEFTVQGLVRADLVLGNKDTCKFLFVEFEGGEENSIFGPKETNQMRDWGDQLERGFSQIVDWSWAIHDSHNSKILLNALGCSEIRSAEYMLICGREDSMSAMERSRHAWRGARISISGSPLQVLTYDELVLLFQAQIDKFWAGS